MADQEILEASLRAVRDAHRVLEAFHREVVAFFQLLDGQLNEDGLDCKLTPTSGNGIVCSTSPMFTRISDWVPTWRGRLYSDDLLQVAEGEAETLDSRAGAMVAVVAGEDDGPAACWFGFARPGENTRYKHSYDFARNGLWNFPLDVPTWDEWASGELEGNGALGVGGRWQFQRVKLSNLVEADKVRRLVAEPLLTKWAEVIRSGK